MWLFDVDRLMWMGWKFGNGRGGEWKDWRRYLRWVLGVNRIYIREKMQREKLKTRTGRRAWRYEKRLEEEKGNALARLC